MTIFSQIATPLGLAIVVAKGTLVLAIGSLAAFALRRSPAVTRHLVWLSTIVGVLLIPVLSQFAPMRLAMLPTVETPPAIASPTRPAVQPIATPPVQPIRSGAVRELSQPTAPRWTAPSYGSIAVGLWLATTGAILAWLLVGMHSMGRIKRGSRPLESTEWQRALDEATGRLRLTPAPRLVMSDQVEMPFACDPFTPTIVLPASAGEWSDDRRRAVLLHELAHVRRRDLVGHTIASVACAVYWFHPMVWMAARRLRVESELASDDVVLDTGVRPSDYAEHLLDMVTSLGRGAPTVALAMARPKDFEGRLVAILDRANRRRAFGGAQVGAMVGLLAIFTVSIAAVVPVRRVSDAIAAPLTHEPSSRTPDSTAAPPVTTRAAVKESAPERLITGRPLSDVTVQSLMRYGIGGIANPMLMILRDADSLHLTGAQADSVATLSRSYRIRLDAIWSPVSRYYLANSANSNELTLKRSEYDTVSRAPQASMDALIDLVPAIVGLLTPEQRERVPSDIATYLDEQHLAAIRAGTVDGLFTPFAMRGGARVGGGSNAGPGTGARGRSGA